MTGNELVCSTEKIDPVEAKKAEYPVSYDVRIDLTSLHFGYCGCDRIRLSPAEPDMIVDEVPVSATDAGRGDHRQAAELVLDADPHCALRR